MKLSIALITIAFCVSHAIPVPEENIDLVNIPLNGDKELDVLTFSEKDGTINERNKRTIGILRELFPHLSQLVEQKIQMIIQFAVRTFGPILLRGGLGGGGGASTSNTDTRTGDDDFDDFDESSENEVDEKKDKDEKVSISLPTFAPETPANKTEVTPLAVNVEAPSRVDLFDSFDDDKSSESSSPSVRAVDEENLLEPSSAGSDAILETIRIARAINNLNNDQNNQVNTDKETEKTKDQDAAAAENTSSSLDELTLDSIDDDENRGKRFLLPGGFGASSSNGQASGGSGGGSGNFLFDIIRQTADRVARGAGSAFRVVAGTESLDSAIKNLNTDNNAQPNDDDQLKADSSRSARSGDLSLLVSGSSGTPKTDEENNDANDASDTEVGKGDGYTEGIPGPVTRLFVLANRGLANLVQDLILRIAQTSERVVNFKARLITALI